MALKMLSSDEARGWRAVSAGAPLPRWPLVWMVAVLALFGVCLGSPSTAWADSVEIPVQIGVGPSFALFTGPVQDNQAPHFGVRIYAKAILERRNLRRAKKKVPKKYRKLLKGQREVRIGHILVPETIFLSPKTNDVGIFGATWRPLKLDLKLAKSPRLSVGAGVLLTYAFVNVDLDAEGRAANPDLADGPTHFFRPGVGASVDLEIPISDTFLISFGWNSGFYVPQEVGGDFLAIGDLDKSIWHIGEAYGLLNFRLPYRTRL